MNHPVTIFPISSTSLFVHSFFTVFCVFSLFDVPYLIFVLSDAYLFNIFISDTVGGILLLSIPLYILTLFKCFNLQIMLNVVISQYSMVLQLCYGKFLHLSQSKFLHHDIKFMGGASISQILVFVLDKFRTRLLVKGQQAGSSKCSQ